MSATTSIEWTDATFNIAWGCAKVSAGCAHCYAEAWAKRHGHAVWGPGGARRTFGEKHWNAPRVWNRRAAESGRTFRVFCSSMADVFEEHETIDAERSRLWDLIRETPALTWQVVTKRPERIQSNLPSFWDEIRGRVWLLTSTEDQQTADLRIPKLLSVSPRPAVYGVSAEPLLGPLDLTRVATGHPDVPHADALFDHAGWTEQIEWVIVGGESGPGARPCDVAWVRSIVEQCRSASVPVFVRQLGALAIEHLRCLACLGIAVDHNGRVRHCHECDGSGTTPRPMVLRDRKGGDPAEWPEDLRVREFPAVRS